LKHVITTGKLPSFVTKSEKTGKATVPFGKLDSDSLYNLSSTKLLGGAYRIGDFEERLAEGTINIIVFNLLPAQAPPAWVDCQHMLLPAGKFRHS